MTHNQLLHQSACARAVARKDPDTIVAETREAVRLLNVYLGSSDTPLSALRAIHVQAELAMRQLSIMLGDRAMAAERNRALLRLEENLSAHRS